LEGFSDFLSNKHPARIEDVYKRIERIVGLTVWEVNMLHYKKIAESLVKVGRAPKDLFFKIENHVRNNLGMEYDL
jgi:hypothetical protein